MSKIWQKMPVFRAKMDSFSPQFSRKEKKPKM